MIDSLIGKMIMGMIWGDNSNLPELQRDEVLALLGFGHEPGHSLTWYLKNYRHLKGIIMNQIKEDIEGEGIFPKEAKLFAPSYLCKIYPATISKNGHGLYRVTMHDKECGEVVKRLQFDDLDNASEYLLRHSNCSAAAMRKLKC
jgi:hypothetical protein